MKANLFGKSNAVLMNEGEVVAIIKCKANDQIRAKLQIAIQKHYTADSVYVPSNEVLTNQAPLLFSANLVIEGEDEVRDFTIEITATY